MTCSVDSCDSKRVGKGFCWKHLRRFNLYGDPLGGPGKGVPRTEGFVKYSAIHRRLRIDRGPARNHLCECGAQARQWAYDHADPNGLVDVEGPYSLDLNHYVPMCIPCHKHMDLERLGV